MKGLVFLSFFLSSIVPAFSSENNVYVLLLMKGDSEVEQMSERRKVTRDQFDDFIAANRDIIRYQTILHKSKTPYGPSFLFSVNFRFVKKFKYEMRKELGEDAVFTLDEVFQPKSASTNPIRDLRYGNLIDRLRAVVSLREQTFSFSSLSESEIGLIEEGLLDLTMSQLSVLYSYLKLKGQRNDIIRSTVGDVFEILVRLGTKKARLYAMYLLDDAENVGLERYEMMAKDRQLELSHSWFANSTFEHIPTEVRENLPALVRTDWVTEVKTQVDRILGGIPPCGPALSLGID